MCSTWKDYGPVARGEKVIVPDKIEDIDKYDDETFQIIINSARFFTFINVWKMSPTLTRTTIIYVFRNLYVK